MSKKMIIIGGGAAGMMTAIKAADNGFDVTVMEKNEKLGKKLFITGKGRCNFTNYSDSENFLKNVISNPKFLYSAIDNYDAFQVMKDFEAWGLKTKVERGNRAFPESDHSSDVIKTLEDAMKKRNVKIMLHTEVEEVLAESIPDVDPEDKKKQSKRIVGVKANGRHYIADVVVVAAGGISYPSTGSTGDGYRFAKEAGHSVTELRPALVPFNIKESFCKDMMGLSLKNVTLKCILPKDPSGQDKKRKKDKVLYEEMGEMLFTHFGVSGPLVLSASSYLKGTRPEETILTIDLKPALSEEELDERIKKDFEKYKSRELINSLGDLLPRLMIPVMVECSGIEPEKRVSLISKEERERLVKLFKNFTLHPISLRSYNEAIITAAGVSVKEISPKTMESKMVSGLRFAGEVLDLDALTGGYNLQIAWSTAALAAMPLLEETE